MTLRKLAKALQRDLLTAIEGLEGRRQLETGRAEPDAVAVDLVELCAL
jgi:hypothetical protein